MSIPTVRQPAGTPIGGQFAATARPETGIALDTVADPAGEGLLVPDDLDEPTQLLVDALEAIGLNGTVRHDQFRSPGWARVEVDLASGHELSVGVSRCDGSIPHRKEGTIDAITVALRPSDLIDDDGDFDVQTIGGSYGEVEIGQAVQQALIACAAHAEFGDRFPDAPANGCYLEYIGQENGRITWHRIGEPRPQIDGARFSVPGGDVLVTTLNGEVDLEADGTPLRLKDSYLRELAASDVTRRLGLTHEHGAAADTLAATVADVIAASRRRPVVTANLRPIEP